MSNANNHIKKQAGGNQVLWTPRHWTKETHVLTRTCFSNGGESTGVLHLDFEQFHGGGDDDLTSARHPTGQHLTWDRQRPGALHWHAIFPW